MSPLKGSLDEAQYASKGTTRPKRLPTSFSSVGASNPV
jgi:hypothetical protein